MYDDHVKQTYCGDHFTICTNIKSLCGTPETNIMSYVNYTSTFFKVAKHVMKQGLRNKRETQPRDKNFKYINYKMLNIKHILYI